MPTVTVIMPSYNVKKYITECMESVCNQTLKDIEILSVDAGSTDGTLEILREYEKRDSRIKVIISEKKSYGYQVNKGIQLAKGEYIAIVETDDIAENCMLEVLYKPAKDYGLDYVKGDYAALVSFADGIGWMQNSRIYPVEKDIYGKILVPNEDNDALLKDVFLWRGIYKKEFLLENDICLNETDGAAYQDVGFLFQTISHAKRAMYIPDIVYYYRQNNAGSSIYNPRAYGYLLGEYPFLKEQLEKKQLFNDDMQCSYYIRLFTQIMTRYRTMAASGSIWEGTEEARLQLRKWVEDAYEAGYYDVYRMGKALYMELQQYLDSEEGYWQYQLSLYNAKRKCVQELLDKACNTDAIVFYSKSMVGGFVFSLLKTAGIEKPVCFCDNDEKKHGTMYMNAPVISVEEAVEKYPAALYVIANRRFDVNMQKQLLDLGISKSQISVWLLDTDILLLGLVKNIILEAKDGKSISNNSDI